MSLKLKLLRLQAGLTLEELARATDLTKSYVSKLERGLSTPSIGAGLKLARVLGVTAEELFSEALDDDSVVVRRAPNRRDASPQPPRVITGALQSHKMVAFVVTPGDQAVRDHPMSHHRGEEFLYVLKGSVSFRLARRVETLHAGDSVHFNASIPHKITSIGERPALVLLVVAQED